MGWERGGQEGLYPPSVKEPPLGKEAALFIPFLQSPHPEGPRFKSGVCS